MSGPDRRNGQEDDQKPDFLEKRGFTWVALVVLLVVTLLAMLVLVYLISVRNTPHTEKMSTSYCRGTSLSNTGNPSRIG